MAAALLDTNVLVHAGYRDSPLHSAAATLVDRSLRKRGAYCLAPRSRRLSKIYPSRGTVLRSIREGRSLGITGPAWYDLFLAVTMRETGVKEIITENIRDFAKFPFITACPITEA